MLKRAQNLLFIAAIIPVVALFNTAGRARGTQAVNGMQEGQTQQTRFSASDLKKLRWIEGTWRGMGDVDKPFFERYHFENDTTLVVESFSDETLSNVTEVTRFELRDGKFGNWGTGARWAATRIDENSITFEPVAGARNAFRWMKQSKDIWNAMLNWPATENSPAKQKIYQMERLRASK
ncbi:MAG TPA: hypothetical protein VF543_15735 [Pyrinomonadaceae bacterium]